jgi:uncharacterized membrane protein (UPF0127 family)
MAAFRRTLVFLLPFLLLVSCSLKTITLHVGNVTFRTEIADTPALQEHGLMGRTDLTDDSAMLFVFPDETQQVFWMKDTPTPLSIAYISKSGEIKEILDMEPFSLDRVPSRHAVKYALEVKQGAFTRRGVQVGDFLSADDLKGLSADR